MERASFTERNDRLINKYGHLLDNAKHASNNPFLNQLEENKLAILMDNSVREECSRQRIPYESIDLSKLEETNQTGIGSIAYNIRTQLAMIGKIFPNMITKNFTSWQPIDQSDAKIFYSDFKRDDDTSTSEQIHAQRNYANNVEYDPDSPTAVKTLTYEITSETISAVSKKLKGKVTIEVEQDLRNYHGQQAMPIVTNHMAAEITREWDRTVLAHLFSAATGGTAYFNKVEPAGLSYEDRKYWMETLYERLIAVDTAIFKKRYRKTNYIVVPADEAGFIENMHGFVSDSISADQKVIKTGGRYFSGTLKGRWAVYVDPFIEGEILMGYNNPNEWTETSYVFAPYELAYLTDPFVDANTFVKVQGIMSRAARKAVIPDLLGKVIVTSS